MRALVLDFFFLLFLFVLFHYYYTYFKTFNMSSFTVQCFYFTFFISLYENVPRMCMCESFKLKLIAHVSFCTVLVVCIKLFLICIHIALYLIVHPSLCMYVTFIYMIKKSPHKQSALLINLI